MTLDIVLRMKKLTKFKIFFIVNSIVILICLFFGRFDWLINTQVAFISSVIITLGSYYGYRKNIETRIKEHTTLDLDDKDELDKYDDKYDLYSDEVKSEYKEEDITKEQIKEAMKPIKQNYFNNFKSGLGAMGSFYRIFGYVILIIGFFYLRNNEILDIYSYLVGFSIVPLATLIYTLQYNK